MARQARQAALLEDCLEVAELARILVDHGSRSPISEQSSTRDSKLVPATLNGKSGGTGFCLWMMAGRSCWRTELFSRSDIEG